MLKTLLPKGTTSTTHCLSSSAAAAIPEPSAVQNSKKPTPSDTQNGQFNRFGFKVKKAEAREVVTNKPAAFSRTRENREIKRSILKGVRTNRPGIANLYTSACHFFQRNVQCGRDVPTVSVPKLFRRVPLVRHPWNRLFELLMKARKMKQ